MPVQNLNMLMVAECVFGPHVSGESPLYPPLQLFFYLYAVFLLSSLYLPPTISSTLSVHLSFLSHTCQQTPISLSHIQMCTHWIGKHAYECKQPRPCIQKTVEEQTTSDAYFLTAAEWFFPVQQHIAYMQSHSPC